MLRKRDLSSPLAEFLGILVVTVILWLGGQMVFNGQIEPETLSEDPCPFEDLQRGIAGLHRRPIPTAENVNSAVGQFRSQAPQGRVEPLGLVRGPGPDVDSNLGVVRHHITDPPALDHVRADSCSL